MKIFKRVFSVLLAILLTPLISTVAYAKSTNDVTFNSGKAYLDTGWADDEFMIAFNWTSTKKVTNYGIYIWDSEGNDVEGVDTLDKYNTNMGPGTYNCLFCVYAVEPDGSTLGELYVGKKYYWQGYVMCEDGIYFSPEYSFVLTLDNSRFKNITSPTVNYLALSYLSYRNLNGYVDKTVRDYIVDHSKESFQGTDISLYQLCKGVLDYKILTTSQKWGKAKGSGFSAVTFFNEKTGEVIIAYRGTNSGLLGDDVWDDDLSFQVFHEFSPQLGDAIDYNEYCIEYCMELGIPQFYVRATGHSLGGALATTVSMACGARAEVFNSASVYKALYSNKPELMGELFEGVDLWRVRTHINQHDIIISKYEDEFRNLRHVVYEDTNKTIFSHSLPNMVYKDPDGNVRMSAPAEYHRLENIPEAFSTTANGNKIYFGSSKDDTIRHRTKKDALIYGGNGSDKIYCYEKTNDVIVGENHYPYSDSFVNILSGGLGNDTYIYYYPGWLDRLGRETIIKDVGGSDCLKIIGEPEYISYKETSIAGESFALIEIGAGVDTPSHSYDRIYISLNRDSNSNFVVDNESSKTETLLIGKWGKFRSVLISCPVDIDIFDPDGNLVLTLEHETELDVSTPFGNFHVFTDENGESCKYYDLMDGYTAQIRGVGEGTMDINVIHDGDNPNSPGSGVMNVPITPTTTATINYSAGNVPVLSITDASGTTDISLQTRHEITLLPENGEDPYTEFTEFDNSVPELPTPYRSGYTFLGWKSSEGSFVDKGDVITEDITLKAQWKSNSTKTINNDYYWWYLTAISNRYFDVTADTTEGGEVVLSATRIKYDKSITLSIMPDEGYMIDQFILNGQVIPIKDSSVTLYNIRCDQTIFVSFKKIS